MSFRDNNDITAQADFSAAGFAITVAIHADIPVIAAFGAGHQSIME